MIKSFANSATRQFANEGKSKFSGLDVQKAQMRIAALHAAGSLNDLGTLKSVGVHKLRGKRKEQWAMAINGPWRLCFRFIDGNAFDVEIVDYH